MNIVLLLSIISTLLTTTQACPNHSSLRTLTLKMPETYNKAFIPLESNPKVFNELIAALGASPNLHFQDVFTLDDPTFLPPKILALILVFPTTPTYEARLTAEDAGAKDWMVEHDEEDEDAVWFKQTINNACGLYAVLHALANGRAKDFLSELA